MNDHKWPDGTVKSRNNAFCWPDWQLQCDWGQLNTSAKLKAAQTARVERAREAGETFTLAGVSRASDERARQTRQQWHGGAYSKAVPSS